MAGRMDRYVAKSMWGAYGAGLLFLLLLSSLLDLLVRIGDYIDAAQSKGVGVFELLRMLAEYYALLSPIVFVTVSPFVTVIAGMFAVSRLMGANEIMPMLFTGRHIARALRPVLAAGMISALSTAALWEFVVPAITGPLSGLRHVLDAKNSDSAIENLVIKIREGGVRHTMFCKRYDYENLRMEEVMVVGQGADASDPVLVLARAADWNPEAGDWDLEAGERREWDLETRQARLGLGELTPELLWRSGKEGRETVELSYSDLLDLQDLRPGRLDYVLAFHTHITFPLANVVLLLLALPFAVDFERGSKVGRVIFAVMVCALYLVTDLTCQNLAQSHLHPVLAAWLPTILFGSVGVAFFTGIRT